MSDSIDVAQTTGPTDPYLEAGPKRTASDMRVVSGYPIWNLIDAWMATGYADAEVIEAYGLDPRECDAARRYYREHKAVFDAQLIRQLEPMADDLPPGLSTADEFFAWMAQRPRRVQS